MQESSLQSTRSSAGPFFSAKPKLPPRTAQPERAMRPGDFRFGALRRPQPSLAVALGWLSVGVGLAQLLAPRRTARMVGMQERPAVMRALGTREVASGIGILSGRRRSGWLWSRVAGDVLDMALLAAAFSAFGASRRRRAAIAAAAVSGIAALDVVAGVRQVREAANETAEINFAKSIAINRTPQECYAFWRNFGNFPRFMRHVKDVRVMSDTRSHWTVKGPAGAAVEWEADITYDQPGQMLVWHSLAASQVDNAGQVRFEPGPRGNGTIVHVELQYRPPGGRTGEWIAKLFGESPEQQIEEDIRRFKQLIETGEIPTAVGQSSGPRSLAVKLFRKGQPG